MTTWPLVVKQTVWAFSVVLMPSSMIQHKKSVSIIKVRLLSERMNISAVLIALWEAEFICDLGLAAVSPVFRHLGLVPSRLHLRGLRRGLHSFAAPRLLLDRHQRHTARMNACPDTNLELSVLAKATRGGNPPLRQIRRSDESEGGQKKNQGSDEGAPRIPGLRELG